MTAIKDSVALVTGASSGIGEACARELAKRGAKVVLVARSEKKLHAIAQDIEASGGVASSAVADLSSPEQAKAAYDGAQKSYGDVDILINNAGAGKMRFIDDTTPQEAQRCMDAPYFAAFFMSQLVVPDMIARQRGHIVNVTSAASYLSFPGATAYISARWALRGFTGALRSDVRGTGVTVSLATFAKVSSPYFANNPGSEEKVPKAQKLVKVLTPAQVADIIASGIESGKDNICAPALLRALLKINQHTPPIINWLTDATGMSRD